MCLHHHFRLSNCLVYTSSGAVVQLTDRQKNARLVVVIKSQVSRLENSVSVQQNVPLSDGKSSPDSLELLWQNCSGKRHC